MRCRRPCGVRAARAKLRSRIGADRPRRWRPTGRPFLRALLRADECWSICARMGRRSRLCCVRWHSTRAARAARSDGARLAGIRARHRGSSHRRASRYARRRPRSHARSAACGRSAIGEALGQFVTWLLLGVTGSGKTEVYLRLIDKSARSRAADVAAGAGDQSDAAARKSRQRTLSVCTHGQPAQRRRGSRAAAPLARGGVRRRRASWWARGLRCSRRCRSWD